MDDYLFILLHDRSRSKSDGLVESSHRAYSRLNSSMSTSTSKVVVHAGDLFASAPTGSILVHACNTQGVWGSGIAAAFKARFPQAYEVYHATCKENGDSLLGQTLLIDPQEDDTKANGGGKGYAIACLFTSRKFGKYKDPKDVILQSTKTAVVQLKKLLAQKEMQDWPIYGW
jgi:ADP-ribose 1''-phosphate phosphatase